MSYWVAKALIQGMISKLPLNVSRDYFFHKFMRKSVRLNEETFSLKITECRRHLESYFSLIASKEKRSFSVFELGTGWFPILPVAFYLCGAFKIFTIDRTDLLTIGRVKEVLARFADYAERDELVKILPWAEGYRASRLQEMLKDAETLSVIELLKELNIHFIVCDAKDTGLAPSSIDFFVSNVTLEYIPENILIGIFKEFRRLASPGALMSHLIITSDHYADVDHSITPFNFLKYPTWLWKIFNNSWHYQSRLRPSDYYRIHCDAGFNIIEKHDDHGSVSDLKKIRVSKDFNHYSKDDLLIIRTRIVSAFGGDGTMNCA